ncbi:MAG: SpoIID/LytB domain-containing protein [Synergistaceae bacterium]|nr:SpoIID/LytB domain-containing protein [Synergistaceae bacterium]
MKKRLILFLIAVVLLFAASFSAVNAVQEHFVNGGTALDMALGAAYAVGGDGSTATVGTGTVYALTGKGLQQIDGDDYSGGGGLRYEDGSVILMADRVSVGLAYYYSEKRDGSLEEARLENAVGSGYAFGYFNAKRQFVPFLDEEGEIVSTGETKIAMRPLGGGAIGVYITGTDELLFSVQSSGKDNYLAVSPLPGTEQEALTWFSNKRYYGDFGYADLGNGKLTVINLVDMEHYTMGVCAGEMGTGFPLEALKAQAVCARSYAMYQMTHTSTYMTKCGFDVTNEDYSQVYVGYTASEKLISAARETENQYLTYNGSVCDAVYSAADGGETLNSEAAGWGYIAYLRGVTDPYESTVWDRGVYGHQVGMSQWGAYAMVKNFNKNYKDVLGFYFTDVGLSYGKLLED